MSKVLITESYLEDIADSIRAKNGTDTTYKPSEMSGAIDAISEGGITPTGTKEISITQNGTTTEDVTNYASAEITVNVSGGGGSSGTEATVTTAKTNASACIKEIISPLQNGHVYIGCIKNKSVSNFVTDQLIAFVTYIDNQNTNGGGCLRYRNSAFASAGTSVTYDAKVEVGDVYVYYDFDFSS